MIVVDASVMVKWALPEAGYEAAKALRHEALAAPELCYAECANALWRRSRLGEFTAEQAVELLRALQAIKLEITPMAQLAFEALTLATSLNHPVYDCFYLAVAVARDCSLVTADTRFHKAVAGSPYAGRVRLLGV